MTTIIKEIENMSDSEVHIAIDYTQKAQFKWKEVSIDKRIHHIIKLAEELDKNKEHYATIITQDMGKVYKESIAEIAKCIKLCKYYASNSPDFLADQIIETEASKSYVSYRPLGIILGIMPWNFPFWQVFRYAIPTFVAGNGCLLKHASNVSNCALELDFLFKKAGFPIHLFKSLFISTEQVNTVIENPSVKAVTLTGSTKAGRAVAKKAGEMLKKTVMELGGSDPYIILEDADLDHAVEKCVKGRLINSGQSCIAAKRFVVVESVKKEFTDKVVAAMTDKIMGDPLSNPDLGPMARTDLRDEVNNQVSESIKKGAKLLTGGDIPDMEGAFYPATVLDNVGPGMPAYEAEIFGPVASIITAKDEEDAIRIANDTSFGLGAAVFTSNIENGMNIAELKLEAGNCFVNELVHSDPRLPFGGIKDSGFGRELGSLGIKEFVNAKTVYVG